MLHSLEHIKSAASELADEDLRALEVWIRNQLDPPMGPTASMRQFDSDDHRTYRLKYFRCGNAGCRCMRGHLHGPYLFATRHAPDGSHRQHYIGRVAVDRPDDERQLELF